MSIVQMMPRRPFLHREDIKPSLALFLAGVLIFGSFILQGVEMMMLHYWGVVVG